MSWPRGIIWIALLACWACLGAWQYREYRRECDAARATLRRQADAVLKALVGGIRSHRRVGPFFEEQVQGVLDGLAGAEGVRAVAVVSPAGKVLLGAGTTGQLAPGDPLDARPSYQPEGFRLVQEFDLTPEPAGGPGIGRGPGWRHAAPFAEETPGPFAGGGRFAAVLLLDRTDADAACDRAAWSRSTVTAAAALLLLGLGLVWRGTVRLAAARGEVEAEARHFRELSQAAAGLAHETRNPLGLIRGLAQRLGHAGPAAPDQEPQARAIVEECDRVTARINQFLTFARPARVTVERLDLGALLDELAVLLGPDLEDKSLTIRRTSVPPGAALRADRELLRQALFNLLRNAVQWSPERGAVEVSLRHGPGGRFRLEVADRGPGVPAAARAALFTPYFTTRPDGTGLGLAIVRRIAAAHGWEAGHSPRDGGGAVFWLGGIHG